jgi:hypothetical protein
MANGNTKVIEQIREIVTAGGKIDAKTRDLLLFSAIIDIYEQLEIFRPMLIFYRVGMFFASALGLSVVALIWALLTGTVRLDVAGR